MSPIWFTPTIQHQEEWQIQPVYPDVSLCCRHRDVQLLGHTVWRIGVSQRPRPHLQDLYLLPRWAGCLYYCKTYLYFINLTQNMLFKSPPFRLIPSYCIFKFFTSNNLYPRPPFPSNQTRMISSSPPPSTLRLSTCVRTGLLLSHVVWPVRWPRCPCTERSPQKRWKWTGHWSPTTQPRASSSRSPVQSTRECFTVRLWPKPSHRSPQSTSCFTWRVGT